MSEKKFIIQFFIYNLFSNNFFFYEFLVAAMAKEKFLSA